MKTAKPLKPVVITSHPVNYVLGGAMLLFCPFMLWIAFGSGFVSDSMTDVILPVFMALLCAFLGLALLLSPLFRRITVSTEGVTIVEKHSNICVKLPWTEYRFMYRLHGYKVSYDLFSPTALTRQAQYEVCSACMRAKHPPLVQNGCFILPNNLYGRQITDRLPDSIHIVPDYECGTLWNKGKG